MSAPPRRATWPHHAALGAFTFVWAANFVLAEIALAQLTPIAFSVARFAVAALALGLIFGPRASRHPGERTLRRSDAPRLFAAAALGAALGPWLGIEGLARTHAGRASLFVAVAPAVSALFGALTRSERIDRRGLVGLALAIGGALVLAVDGLSHAEPYWLGDALLLGGVVAVVLELHLLRPLLERYGPDRVVLWRTALGTLLYAALAASALWASPWGALEPLVWLAILGGGAIGVGLGQWVKTRALEVLGPTRVVVYGNLVPFATLLLAFAWLDRPLRPLELGAGALVVLGALALRARASPTDTNVVAPLPSKVSRRPRSPSSPSTKSK